MPFSVNTNAPVEEGSYSLKESGGAGDIITSFARKTPVVGTKWHGELYIDQQGTQESTQVIWAHSGSGSLDDGYGIAVVYASNGHRAELVRFDGGSITVLAKSDISGTSLNFTQSQNVGTENDNSGGLYLGDGSTKVYIGNQIDSSNGEINEYTLSQEFDLGSASFNQNLDVSSEDPAVGGVAFGDSGSKMYMAGTTGGSESIYEYDLLTAWDISTATLNQSLDISGDTGTITGVFVGDGGSKLYVNDTSNDDVIEYNLSTAWDISTASLNQRYDYSADTTDGRGLAFRDDGQRMLLCRPSTIIEYSLSTAWDVSTATNNNEKSTSTQEGDCQGVESGLSGAKNYIVGDGSLSAHEYTYDHTLPLDAWMTVEVEHLADGSLTVVFDDGGDNLTLTATDSTHLNTDNRYVNHGTGYRAPAAHPDGGGNPGNAVDDMFQQAQQVVEDWESGDLSSWSGDNASYAVDETTPVSQPTFSLKCPADSTKMIVSAKGDGLDNYPELRETHEILFWGQDTAAADGAQDFYFGSKISSGSVDEGYLVRVQMGDALGGGVLDISRKDPGGITRLNSVDLSTNIPREVWLTVRIHHAQDGTITATLLDETGAQIGEITATDTTYISGSGSDAEYYRTGIATQPINSDAADAVDLWRIV